jgi:glycosyltransferase involved in cell wall biosynthesis
VQDERTGLVVPASNERLLSGAIARLLGDRALRERLGAAARDAVAGYDYTAMAAAFGRALRVAGVAS